MYENSLIYARQQDERDPLRLFRDKFYIPVKNDRTSIYFCGNSLGLQPKSVERYFDIEFEKWQQLAVEGHFQGENPWVSYHYHGKKALAGLLGTKEHEVVIMNNLTTNLHLLLASFYQPEGKRKKIIIEEGAFPSDHYAVSSHMEQKGVDPDSDLILIKIPDNGYLSNEKVVDVIRETGEQLALVMLPGVQYYTGQYFNMKKITHAAHEVGALAGFDLAHAIGNLPMDLHNDKVDFATWCSYKYLNSGPGNVSGIFIHEKHANNPDTPKLKGWWGHNEKTRFTMDNNFDPMPGVDSWMLSNVNVLATSIHLGSLRVFEEAGIDRLREKSVHLTGFLEFLLSENEILNKSIQILTPSEPEERGCQLSLYFHSKGRKAFEYLSERSVIMDWREPNVIRVAPTPLYNTFEEVYEFVELLSEAMKE